MQMGLLQYMQKYSGRQRRVKSRERKVARYGGGGGAAAMAGRAGWEQGNKLGGRVGEKLVLGCLGGRRDRGGRVGKKSSGKKGLRYLNANHRYG
jgi:hypothetical protein